MGMLGFFVLFDNIFTTNLAGSKSKDHFKKN